MTTDAPRTALVTGANSGIGLATVIELARRGFHAVGSVRSPAKPGSSTPRRATQV